MGNGAQPQHKHQHQQQQQPTTTTNTTTTTTPTTSTTESPSTTSSPEDCDQFKTDQSCELDESNIIKERHNLLVGECQDICVGNSECNFFTWYPVPDQVEMGNDHANCWLLRHCNSWEVCQACVSGPAGETDVDNCL